MKAVDNSELRAWRCIEVGGYDADACSGVWSQLVNENHSYPIFCSNYSGNLQTLWYQGRNTLQGLEVYCMGRCNALRFRFKMVRAIIIHDWSHYQGMEWRSAILTCISQGRISSQSHFQSWVDSGY